jgi:hypothetical protein
MIKGEYQDCVYHRRRPRQSQKTRFQVHNRINANNEGQGNGGRRVRQDVTKGLKGQCGSGCTTSEWKRRGSAKRREVKTTKPNSARVLLTALPTAFFTALFTAVHAALLTAYLNQILPSIYCSSTKHMAI